MSQYHQEYNILLIITDGIINDMKDTIDQIVRGSDLPLSVVIVGVGGADFSNMDVLDADETPLYSNKYRRHMGRDIVQFVPFNEFKHNPLLLAKQTLEEIPGQLVDFFLKRNIQPKPAKEDQRAKIAAQLSLRSKGDPSQKMDLFQESRKNKLVDRCSEMGMDTFEVQDLLNERGVWENSMDLVVEAMNNKQYVNVLKIPKQLPVYGQQLQPPQQQYGQPVQQYNS